MSACARFFAPGVRRPGPLTECYACGASRQEHRPPEDPDPDEPQDGEEEEAA